MSFFKGSPYRRHTNNNDVEAGGGSRGDEDEESSSSNPFNITSTKNASIERLRKWRQAALVLNASRRFRYTLDLKREEERQQLMRKVRVNIEAIRAANRFKAAGEQRNGTSEASPPPPSPSGGHFAIGQDQLVVMSRDHDVSALQQCGGVKGLSELLKTNLEKGINGDDADLLKRKNAFGSNTYPKKKGRSFWMFLWEAWQDLTLIILIVAAVASLALGIKSEMMVILVSAFTTCRPGVKDAVQLCQKAGIKVRMVTGDNIQTAKAIASECRILGSDDNVTEPTLIEGRVFRELPELRREEIVDQISVMGRSSPNDKLLLVQALRKKGHVVAVTGDGTNDAPALHEADIGLAMGISVTEVAKESSDIVILDDNFASVVKVVRWGRSVYANIQKFIQFQLTVNVAALIINVVAAVSSGDVPLNAVQLLWVNLIMDTLGALALATEPPTDHLMDRPPVGRREPLITNIMWRNLLIQALYQVAVLLVLNFQGRSILKLEGDTIAHATKVKNTLIFNAFVLCQIFNEFNARKPDEFNVFKGITKNYLFMGIVGATVVLQVLIIEFLGKFTSTVKLNWSQWLISVIIGIISWPLAVLGKLIPVSETPIGNGLKKLKFCRRGASQS